VTRGVRFGGISSTGPISSRLAFCQVVGNQAGAGFDEFLLRFAECVSEIAFDIELSGKLLVDVDREKQSQTSPKTIPQDSADPRKHPARRLPDHWWRPHRRVRY
jgi:hypothetical protein